MRWLSVHKQYLLNHQYLSFSADYLIWHVVFPKNKKQTKKTTKYCNRSQETIYSSLSLLWDLICQCAYICKSVWSCSKNTVVLGRKNIIKGIDKEIDIRGKQICWTTMADETCLERIVWHIMRLTDNAQQRLNSSGKLAESELAIQYNDISE